MARGKGEGNIRKRADGTWEARFSLGTDEIGKRKSRSLYGKTRKEVQEKLNKELHSVGAGTYTDPSRLKVSEWLETWLEKYAGVKIGDGTYIRYESQIRLQITPYIGSVLLKDLRPPHIQRLVSDLLKKGRVGQKKKEKPVEIRVTKAGTIAKKPGPAPEAKIIKPKNPGLAARTVIHIHTMLKSALEQAVADGLIASNPASHTVLPSPEKIEMSTLGMDNLATFWEAAMKSDHFVDLAVALSTGARRGEVLGEKWTYFDEDAGVLEVAGQISRHRDRETGKSYYAYTTKLKTKNAYRRIRLSAEIVELLQFHKKRQLERRIAAGGDWEDNGFIFCGELGRFKDPDAFSKAFARILRHAGLPKIRLHDLRHTFATIAYQVGADDIAVSRMLGHYSVAFTKSQYGHLTDFMRDDVVGKVATVITLPNLPQE